MDLFSRPIADAHRAAFQREEQQMSDPFTVSGSSESQDFQPLEGGVHRGQLAALVHQPDTPGYQGGDPTDQIIAVFVTPDVLDSQGEPRQVRKFLNLPNNPMHEKAGLRRFIEQWIGKKLSDAQIKNAAAQEVPRQARHARDADRHIGQRPRVREADGHQPADEGSQGGRPCRRDGARDEMAEAGVGDGAGR